MKKILLTATTLLLLVSCTVKEDRAGCPCWLDVDVSQCGGLVRLLGYGAGGRVIDETVDPLENPVCTYTVPKGMLTLSALSGLAEGEIADSTLTCRPGRQFPKASLYMATVKTSDQENVEVVVTPHKVYSEITFYLPEGMEFLAPSVTIQTVSTSVGYDLTDATVLRGEFTYATLLDDRGSGSVRVPRQKYGDLTVIVYLNGERYRVIDLWSELDRRGYDWDERDLKDVSIVLEIGNAGGIIVISDWDPQGAPVERPETE